jgi:hypothetical protein
MKQCFKHSMLILVTAVECCKAIFTGAAAATIAAASVAAVSVAKETENCMGKKSTMTKITALGACISAFAAAAVTAIAIAATTSTGATASCDAVKITLHLENCSFSKQKRFYAILASAQNPSFLKPRFLRFWHIVCMFVCLQNEKQLNI